MRLRDLVYLLLTLLFFPVAIPYLLRGEYRHLLLRRLHPKLPPLRGSIWIHAVSVGEVRSLRRLITALRETTSAPIVLSVTTPSGLAVADKLFPDLAAVIPAPVDLSWVVGRFLRRIQPRLMLFHELEIWPTWIAQLSRRHIPVAITNTRISEKAFRRYRRAAWLLRPAFAAVTRWLVQEETYRERLLRLGVPADRMIVCGSLKADEAVDGRDHLPPADEVLAKLGLSRQGLPLLVVASSHPADEELVLPVLAGQKGRLRPVLVPRHPGRIAEIEAACSRLGLVSVRHSDHPGPVFPAADLLIYDRIGYLFPILSVADLVFMGGTCDPRVAGHNLYEPASLGRPIAGGPHCENFAAIAEALRRADAYRTVTSTAELSAWLAEMNPERRHSEGARARTVAEESRGALACTLSQLRPLLAH